MVTIHTFLFALLTFACAAGTVCGEDPYHSTANLPMACIGRFCPLESAALSLPKEKGSSPLEQLWNKHFQEAVDDGYSEAAARLEQQGASRETISRSLAANFPIETRLRKAGSSLPMLPLRTFPGEWASLHALDLTTYNQTSGKRVPIGNFTAFSDPDFYALRNAYHKLRDAQGEGISSAAKAFADAYRHAYTSLEGRTYKSADGKALAYPTTLQLQAESFYSAAPLIPAAIIAYGIALLLMAAGARSGWKRCALYTCIGIGFLIHTFLLALRCYILQRPPVSNMFETVVYVPWVAMATGFLFAWVSRSRIILTAATAVSVALLALLQVTRLDAKMENVQAVLDSQYWLIIHVLMVVGSYGAFAVSGILGHFYLVDAIRQKAQSSLGKGILHTMYLGVGLLIPGTILGGVWAAQSWGRFWDWDPKESWAFITACIYLLVIHAHTFKKIGDFGLAVGSVAGLMAVSFTWYGVNYVLGTGLHTYGFGNGGEWIYFAYLVAELAFLSIAISRVRISLK